MSGRHYFAVPGELNKRQKILLAVVDGRACLDSIGESAEIPVPTVLQHSGQGGSIRFAERAMVPESGV